MYNVCRSWERFYRVPRRIWLPTRTAGTEEWTVSLVHAMYENFKSTTRIDNEYNEVFPIIVGFSVPRVTRVHCWANYSLLFWKLSHEFKTGCPQRSFMLTIWLWVDKNLGKIKEKLLFMNEKFNSVYYEKFRHWKSLY